MDLIIEFIGEVIIEGFLEIIKNKKISKLIRYPLIFIVALIYIAIVALIIYTAILSLKKNIVISIVLLMIAIFLVFMLIFNFLKKQ